MKTKEQTTEIMRLKGEIFDLMREMDKHNIRIKGIQQEIQERLIKLEELEK